VQPVLFGLWWSGGASGGEGYLLRFALLRRRILQAWLADAVTPGLPFFEETIHGMVLGARLVTKNFHLLFEHMYEALNVIK